MKKVLKAIAATFVFFGLATFAVFLMETTGSSIHPDSPSRSNLTADIAANNPLDTENIPTPSEADSSTSTSIQDVSLENVSSAPSSSLTDATVTPVATVEIVQPQTSTTPVAPTNTISAAVAATPDTSTVATVTITVTPTAPPIFTPLKPTAPQISANDALLLPYQETNFAGDQNWQTSWGATNITWSGFLDLSADEESIGGAVFLKNSNDWSNYAMNATIDWLKGKTVDLMANYNNASNYVFCEYDELNSNTMNVRLAQYLNGNELLLTPTSSISWNGDATNIDLSITVKGLYGICSLNGKTISNDAVGPGISPMSFSGNGTIGFGVDDPIPDNNEIVIKSVDVTQE